MRKRYPTDLSEGEWSKIESLFKTDPKKEVDPLNTLEKKSLMQFFTFLAQVVHGAYYHTIFLLGRLFIAHFGIGKT